MNNQKYLSFAHKHNELDWSRVLCAKFGVVRGLNVFMAATEYGPVKFLISSGLFCEERYLQILNNVVLPYLVKKKDMIYVQESNELTMSGIVKEWFEKHPEVNCITWPLDIDIDSPISFQWTNMKNYLKSHFSLSRRKLMMEFWDLLKETSEDLKNSFRSMKGAFDVMKSEHINFVREHSALDWKKILFVRFGVVRCVNVLVAVGQSSPFNVSIADGLLSEERYLKIMNETVLPFLTENKGIIYVQESNEITKSVKVCSWFKLHPEIRCITWPSIVSPISEIWENLNKFVDDNFPLSGSEIKRLIVLFFEELKMDYPNYHFECFNIVKETFSDII